MKKESKSTDFPLAFIVKCPNGILCAHSGELDTCAELLQPAAAEQRLDHNDPTETSILSPETRRMQKSRSQYESFVFWRQPIAEIDLTQLEGLMDGPPANSIKGKDTLSSARSEERASDWIQKRTCSSSCQNVKPAHNKP
ncbi:hypothetical protein EYF80_053802 [Liparis tanakae]|uniref:Putative WW-binding domain-containing protein n=1 Tax=Liparis tanakae TaxID=230148 RepID=A0A4Z2F4L6_9TELE|nr:hypothetical protein EYF80_053802 [Liparis tanakae]